MAPDSLLHQFDDLKFTAEEQDVVFANATAVTIPEDDPRLSPVGRLMSESLGRSLGACIGLVVGTDTRIIDGNMREFLRVRISVDVTKPLRRCVALGGCGSKPRLCPLQYEKLPNFCDGCGFIGHLVVDCPRQPYDPLIKFQYGDWFRVDMKARRVVLVQEKGRIRFHEEAGSSNSHSGFSSLGTGARADVPSGATPFASATPLRSIPVPTSVASALGVATATSFPAEEGIPAPAEAVVVDYLERLLRANEIYIGLYNTDNVWKEGTASVLNIPVDYFSGLFTSSSFENSEILNHILPTVTSDMNASLLRPLTADEVVTAFRDIGPGKASGIDGFPSSFFRLHWTTISSEFTLLCLDLLHGSTDMASINRTVIVLIPKVASPDYMRQFRPISLCTVIYKIVSKVLVNRMKSILPHCILPNQGAFVSGKCITDNIMIGHKLIHSLSSIGTGPYQGAAVKLDIEKAFDRVEWNFLRDVMLRPGFDSSWVSLILRCITIASFTVRINGCLSQDFQPQRGLRQGDPLSPFLLLICTQALSALLTAEQYYGGLDCLCASRNGRRINHLLFADDSFIFIRNSTTEALRLKHILHIYGQASGQRVNYDKSAIFFCPKICQQDRNDVSVILGVHEVTDPGVYLGVPLSIGLNKTAALGFVRDNVNSRIASWNKQLLSFGGREIFIKVVIQSLPQ
ncbi:hypothetical protein GQ457_04G019830 [Hibiscus cannabinus]